MAGAIERIAMRFGLPRIDEADGIALAVAVTVIVAAAAAGWLASRWITPALLRWTAHAPNPAPGDSHDDLPPPGVVDPDARRRRLARTIARATMALVLAITLAAWTPPPWALMLVGLALAVAVGLGVRALMTLLDIGYVTAVAAGIVAAIGALSAAIGGLDQISAFLSGIGFAVGDRRLSLLTLVSATIIAIVLYAAVRGANRLVATLVRRNRRMDATQALLAEKLAGIAILVAAFFIGVDLAGIDLTAFAVFSGAFGLAIGFGLQKTFGNLIAGIILLMDRSIKPGDVIVVGDSFGRVNKIGVRAVSVITRDSKEHLIPNENLMTQEVENWSFSSKNVRVRVPVGISYDADIRVAQDLMIAAAKATPRVIAAPPPSVWLIGFGESSVDFEILCWINDPEDGVGNVRSDVLNRLWYLLKDAGIQIPYPQRDIHIRTATGEAAPPPAAEPRDPQA